MSIVELLTLKEQEELLKASGSELDWDDEICEENHRPEVGPGAGRGKPTIQAKHRSLDSITKQALAALDKNNHPPKLFIRYGEIVRIRKIQDRGSKGQSIRRPVIERLNEHALRGHLARSASFVNVREGRSGELIQIGRASCRERV